MSDTILIAHILIALLLQVPVAALCQDTEPEEKMARPVAPFVVAGGCPFECCGYGKWLIESSARMRANPTVASPITATIPRSTRVTADSGFVRLTRLGRVTFRAPYRFRTSSQEFSRGDTILVLDYVGEGAYNAWARGKSMQVEEYWSANPRDTNSARLLAAPRSEWWSHLTWKSGGRERQGWLYMHGNVKVWGADGCGTPLPPDTAHVHVSR
ncbi:MAG: hypothetical protein ABIY52_18990 [Gemmatimonadaceae bacterium]